MTDIEDKQKAADARAKRIVNKAESWWERHSSAIGWAIAGVIAAVIVILCRSCS